jgi:hypothetical protein
LATAPGLDASVLARAGRSRSGRPTRTREIWRLRCLRYNTLPFASSINFVF